MFLVDGDASNWPLVIELANALFATCPNPAHRYTGTKVRVVAHLALKNQSDGLDGEANLRGEGFDEDDVPRSKVPEDAMRRRRLVLLPAHACATALQEILRYVRVVVCPDSEYGHSRRPCP